MQIDELINRRTPEELMEHGRNQFAQQYGTAALQYELSARDYQQMSDIYSVGFSNGWAQSQHNFLEQLIIHNHLK